MTTIASQLEAPIDEWRASHWLHLLPGFRPLFLDFRNLIYVPNLDTVRSNVSLCDGEELVPIASRQTTARPVYTVGNLAFNKKCQATSWPY